MLLMNVPRLIELMFSNHSGNDIGSTYQTKLFITSRREIDIEEAFTQWQTPRILIEARNVETDIHRYVTEEVARLQKERMLFISDPTLVKQVIEHLSTNSDGMFLWVNLQLKHLCDESESHNDCDVEAALKTLPEDLEKTYQRSLNRILQQSKNRREIALAVLRWTMYSCRRLKDDELWEALKVELEGTNLPQRNEDGHRFITSICVNLIEVSLYGVIRPIHYSVREFMTALQDHRIQNQLLDSRDNKTSIHSRLAEFCICYISSRLVNKAPAIDDEELGIRLYEMPFLWYAARFFDVHMELSSWCRTAIEKCNTLLNSQSTLLTSLLQVRRVRGFPERPELQNPGGNFEMYSAAVEPSMVIFSSRLYHSSELTFHWKNKELAPSLLHFACMTESPEAIRHVLDRAIDVNSINENGETPIYISSLSGNLEAVRLLLKHGADISIEGGYYGTALQAASHEGHTQVVQLLLRTAARDIICGHYGTALQAASFRQHQMIVQMLTDASFDVNIKSGCFATALQAASLSGNADIVRLLLKAGADVHHQGGRLGTAIQAALLSGNENIVRMLLDSGVDVNAPGGFYGSALQAASYDGNEEAVQMLLDSGADINVRAGKFGTALHAASYRGWTKVVQLLLDAGAEINARCGKYDTALNAASSEGFENIVQLLLDAGAEETTGLGTE